ncbi:MAG: tetratricopeptide repeat protein [Euryarchaeota archaeon]|jgi:tetratricopeptide (TPR) repeat protein|nr:tetratricopeptide repeat protein [Euryarchaeota archaeon]MBT4982909.1 tetratricopeptide repeat protein [Euryarchaeota archaeon]MBT5184362.1 tetratricopeptide repeat protein [Euryarchaeota archaeon]
MSAESHYLDAIEAEENGEIDSALEHARLAVEADPEHSNAWWMIACLLSPEGKYPDIEQASKAVVACNKVIDIDPSRVDTWVKCGRLMVDHLGLHEDALAWWQRCREAAPLESVPIIEQVTILSDLGMYAEARDRLSALFEENLDIANSQLARITHLHKTLERSAQQDPKVHFKPWQKNHGGWTAIKMRANKAPVSENMLFMLSTVPFLMMEVFAARALFGSGWGAFCLTSLLILVTVIIGMSFTRKLYQRVNRPGFNLLRAIQFEASCGKVVIPEDIRASKLYMFLFARHPPAFQQRLEKIVEADRKLPRNWKMNLPDFESHYDEIGYIDDEQEEDLTSYEEE